MKPKTEKLGQQVLLEILTKEIETLRETTQVVKQVTPAVQKQLQELKGKTVPVDPTALNTVLDAFEKRIEKRLASAAVMPRWVVALVVVALCWAVGASFLYTRATAQAEENRSRGVQWMDKANSLEKELQQMKDAQKTALERIRKRK